MRSTLLIIIFVIAGFSKLKAQPEPLYLKLFSVKELQQDMDSLLQVLTCNHPDLWRNANRSATEKEWATARSSINEPMTRWNFMRIVSPLVNQYKDGHTYITYFDFDLEEVAAMMEKNVKLFPWDVVLHDDKLWVAKGMTDQTKNTGGLKIRTVNNVPVQKILNDLMPLMAGDYKANTESSCSKFFSFFLWACYGWEGKFEIKATDATGNTLTYNIDGIPCNNYLDIRFPKQDWSLDINKTQDLAIIECRNYRNVHAAKKIIDSAFALIKQKNIGHVAFDIRRNGGGNSAIGDYLLSYITEKSYTDVVSKTIRDGSIIRGFKTGTWENNMLLRYQQEGIKQGDMYTLPFSLRTPVSINFPKNKFTGKFYLLTGPATYSSAHMTALAVKCFKLGSIVGQPTGEQLNLTGESFGYVLPNTKLNASCATAVYKAACGNAKQMGVQPDIAVPFNKTDLQTGTDTVLEKLKQLIK